MRSNIFKIYILFLAVLFLASCRKESTRWDVDLLVPLAKGRLTIASLLPDSLLNTDQYGVVHLSYEKNLLDLNLDTLAEVPDTTVHKMFSPGLGNGSFNVPAGFQLPIDDEETNYDFGNIQVKEVRVKSGILRYVLKNYMNAHLDFTYELPGVELNGTHASIEVAIPLILPAMVRLVITHF
jgi:hypothetical protein